MILCNSFPARWRDLNLYKLLIVETAKRFPSNSWLNYDIVFRKDAAATGSTDWSRINADIFNFHTRSPATSSSSTPAELRCLQAVSRLTSTVTPGMVDAVVGPSGTVHFITHANHVTGTTPASTALNTQLAEHDLAPYHSQRGDPTVVSSPNQDTPSLHSLACVNIGSSVLVCFCSSYVFLSDGVLQQQGLPVKAPNLLFSSQSPGIVSRPVDNRDLQIGLRVRD